MNTDRFALRHIGPRRADLPEMLEKIGVEDIDQLIHETIPAGIRLKKELELEDPRTLTCHNMTIFSAKVLKAFKEKYLLPRGYTYIDLLKKSPYEFSWYNFWLQKDITIPIVFREPLFKMFHTKNQHLEYIRKKITIKDIARGYLGVVVNSNYSRGFGVVGYDQEKLYKVNILKRVLKKLKKYLGLIFP